MEKFTLINKQRDRIKIFKPFQDVSKPSPTIIAMEIQYACVYKRSSKPVIKGSRVEDSTSPTVDRINPLRKIDQELSLRLLHFLSAEMNIPISLPENMPDEDDVVEEAMF